MIPSIFCHDQGESFLKSLSSKSTFTLKKAEQRGWVGKSPLIPIDRFSLFLGKHSKRLPCKNYSINVNAL